MEATRGAGVSKAGPENRTISFQLQTAIKSLICSGLRSPPHHLPGSSAHRILKPGQKSSTEVLFSFMLSSYPHFSKNMTNHPNKTLLLVILEGRSFQRTDSGPSGPAQPVTSANTANRDPTGRYRQHNHLLKKEGALANPSLA